MFRRFLVTKERFEEGGVSLAGLAAIELADVFRLYIEYLNSIHLLTPIPSLADARGRKCWLPDLEFQVLRPIMMQKPRGTPSIWISLLIQDLSIGYSIDLT